MKRLMDWRANGHRTGKKYWHSGGEHGPGAEFPRHVDTSRVRAARISACSPASSAPVVGAFLTGWPSIIAVIPAHMIRESLLLQL